MRLLCFADLLTGWSINEIVDVQAHSRTFVELPHGTHSELVQALLVQRAPKLQARIESRLSDGRFALHAVPSVRAALAHLYRRRVDVIILGVRLADGTAFDLLQALGGWRPPVVIVTPNPCIEHQLRAISFGVERMVDARDLVHLADIVQTVWLETDRATHHAASAR